MKDEEISRMVKEWFAKTTRHEWRRLKQDPYRQIEFLVTMHFLTKYLPKRGLILDAGGGPGRYTIELAKQGYDITLLGLVHEMLKLADRKIRRAGVKKRVEQIVEGSIEDLSMFDDETFDTVLCLGAPLGHILNQQRREKAVKELLRVAKKDAPIFASVISRLGVLKTLLIRIQHEMHYAEHHLEVGDYVPGVHGEGFTAAHWFLPEELRDLFEAQGVEVLEMAGLEGLSSHHPKETNKLSRDEEKWQIWMEVILKTCTHPAVVGSSEHFLLVGKKSHRFCVSFEN
ncbi:MAG: class I SAM-dependent methyltransferase [Candidatus Bathyarchaeia archaeon]